MKIKRLNAMVTVANQLEPDKIVKLKARGYRAIICNRPDGEGADQPGFAELREIASAHGIAMRYVPVALGGATREDHAAFARAIREMEGPFLIYCRSGTRSSTLWQAYEMSNWQQDRPAGAPASGARAGSAAM